MLKPVAIGGAAVAGWPVLAVAGTVMAVDMVAQRELPPIKEESGHLNRQEETHYRERIKDQRSADAQLTRAMSLMLDGGTPHLELALKSAYDEFHRSLLFLEKYHGVIDGLTDGEGKVDSVGSRRHSAARRETSARSSRAPSGAGRDCHPAQGNGRRRCGRRAGRSRQLYASLRKHLEQQANQLEAAETLANGLTENLGHVELKGRWHDTDKSVAARQEKFRSQTAHAPVADDAIEITYLVTPSGEVRQVLGAEETEPAPLEFDPMLDPKTN